MARALAASGSKRASMLSRSASFRFSPCRNPRTTRETPSVNSGTAAAMRMGTTIATITRIGRYSAARRRLLDVPPQEQVRGQPDAAVLDPVGTLGPDAGDDEPPGGVAVHVDAGLLVGEQVVHLDGFALHAGDLADVDHLAPPAGEPARLHDHLDRA